MLEDTKRQIELSTSRLEELKVQEKDNAKDLIEKEKAIKRD